MSIRPISRKSPYTQEDWNETYLPLCAVTTPLEELSNVCGDPIAAVPKCLSCGAPHPTSTTHFRFKNKILCYLCGETSSILLSDQQEIREDEYLDPDLYDQTKFLSPKESRETKKADDDDFDEDFDFSTDTIEFRVPVSQNVYDEAKKGRRSFSQRDKAALATWQYPAMSCPPVWWIVVDGTVGNTTSVEATRNYWTTVGATLSKALEDIPPHVHVGLLTATGSRLASWDLTSAVPHCKQFLYSFDPGGEDGSSGDGKKGELAPETVSEPWDLCLVPANSHYKANLEGAIRGMVDGAMSGLFMEGTSDDGEEKKEDGESKSRQLMPLGLTLEILLEFMEQATHPGQDDEEDEDEDSHGMTKLRYAGGKILCLLGNPTLETGRPPSDDSLSYMGQPGFGLGGVAGACGTTENISDNAESFTRKRNAKSKGKNEKKKKEETVESDPSDLTASNLKGYAMALSPEDLFVQIGNRCAKAALGVDLVVLVPEEDDDNYGGQTIPWYGLPLLRPLSDASGAPGPLMFGTGNIGSVDEAESEYAEKFERLHDNVLARTPWQSGLVFGAQMKFRLSPGLKLENSSLGKPKGSIDPSQFLTVNGLSGPASLLTGDEEEEGRKKTDDEDDEDEQMFVMGSCDPHTSFLVDLEAEGELADSCELEGYGSVDIKPVIQTCTLFTCIETDDAQPTPNYFTVCKMRVSSVALDFAADTESVFDGIDPEALAFILFNKVVLDFYLDGLLPAQKNAELWMTFFMMALYASAKEEKTKLEEEDDSEEYEFVAGDRLLDQDDGSMDETDVLLGEGHFKARFVALLIYAILQCDALRPSGKDYQPSMDARLCAIAQLSSMSPKALAKTLAPSLSLWCLKDDKAILDTLPLSKEGILEAMEELDEKSTENAVLVLESTQGLFLFTENTLQAKKVTKSKYGSLSGSKFRETVDGALVGYRTFPPQWKAIEDLFQGHKYVDLNDLEVSMEELEPMLLEDKPSFAGDRDFTEWRERMASAIKNEVGEDDDGKKKSRGRLSLFLFGGKK